MAGGPGGGAADLPRPSAGERYHQRRQGGGGGRGGQLQLPRLSAVWAYQIVAHFNVGYNQFCLVLFFKSK